MKQQLFYAWHLLCVATLLAIYTTNTENLNDLSSFKAAFYEANELFYKQQYAQAITYYDKALALQPDSFQCLYNKGLCYYELQQFSQAAHLFTKAVFYNPSYHKAIIKAAQAFEKNSEPHQALSCYQQALSVRPHDSDTALAYARLLRSNNQIEQARTILTDALAFEPHNLYLLFELAHLHHKAEQFKEAVERYSTIASLYPLCANVHYNLASALRALNSFQEAIPYYQKAIEHNPNDAHAHYNLGECYLITGNLVQGFQEFEWRWKREADTRNFSERLWDGISSIAGKTILLRAEYGQGDTLQFIRYAQLLKELGAYVILEAQHSLVTLLTMYPFLDKVIPITTDIKQLPHFDVQLPLMSLPHVFATTVETVPNTTPYLQANPTIVKQWQSTVNAHQGVKVGICWQASPYYESFKTATTKKSIPLTLFKPIADVDSVTLFSLQQMNGTEELETISSLFFIQQFGPKFDTLNGRFMDTAAVISLLDIVVTVDTSVAHLAGALGKTVWVLLPYSADWRWLQERTDSPWYPTMRLFRQHIPGDWNSVLHEVANELTQLYAI